MRPAPPSSPAVAAAVGALAGIAGGLIFMAGLQGGPFASLFLCASPLMLFLAGLGWGTPAALIGAVGGTAVLAGVGGVGPSVVFAAFSGAAPLVLTFVALSPRFAGLEPRARPGELLLALAALGAATAVAGLGTAQLSGGIGHLVELSLANSAADMAAVERQLADRGIRLDHAELVRVMTRVLPPAFAAGWMTVSVLAALLAEEILARSGRALCPPPPYSELALPRALTAALAAAIALCFAPGWPGLAGAACVSLLVVVYFFLGLAVIHAMSRRLPARPLMLGVLYLCLALFVVTALVVALLGLIDQWANLRGRAEHAKREME